MNPNESKINELMNKIYAEGVEKANSEAADIVAKAKAEAEAILTAAKNDAAAITDKANSDAAALQSKINQELKTAGNQAMITLKQEIANIITEKALADGVKSAASDAEFIKSLITEIISKWSSDAKSLDLNVILSDKSKAALADFFKNKASGIMSKGVEVTFDARMDNGFKIGPQDKSFVLSFTDKDFLSFFKSFLKPKTKEILFDGE
ncbi:MAG: hypothetical protein IKQ61_06065 [Spirochaetales bacterium]|nr:hypothetical protein [Spirochaetales bacterium]MBR6061027.1 hypothetical protein [Spirochaetales bacterium]MBR6199812.1 hypothetical protein [Spirochaetales bacterium]